MRALAAFAALAALLAGCAEVLPASLDRVTLAERDLACGAPCDVILDASERTASEPAVAADPNDPAHLVAVSIAFEREPPSVLRSWVVAHVSRDGGHTWSTQSLPGGPDAEAAHPLATYTQLADPMVQIVPDGTVVLTGLAMRAAGLEAGPLFAYPLTDLSLFVARSSDGGETFQDIQVLAAGIGTFGTLRAGPVGRTYFTPASAYDRPTLVQGPGGALALAWTHVQVPPPHDPAAFYEARVLLATSEDAGRAWSAPSVVARGEVHHGTPAFGANGTLFVSYYAAIADGESVVMLAASTDGGSTWSAPREVVRADYASNGFLRTAGARLLLVYVEPVVEFPTPALLWSDDGGATWRGPLRLDKPEAPGRVLPTLAVDGRGVPYAGFYHPLPDGNVEFRATAWDGERVASATLTREATRPGGSVLHYVGLAGLPEGAFAVWIGGDAPSTDVHGSLVRTVPQQD